VAHGCTSWRWPAPSHSCVACTVSGARKILKSHSYPQKDVLFLMLPTQKSFASKAPTENRNCLSLPTKAGFFEKVPSDERKRLGATHIWN